VIKRVAQGMWHGARKGDKLFVRLSVAGDECFGLTVSAHGSPFVVIAFEPDLKQIGEAPVRSDIFGWQVIVVIEDRLVLGKVVVKPLGRFALKKKIVVDERHDSSITMTAVDANAKPFRFLDFRLQKARGALTSCASANTTSAMNIIDQIEKEQIAQVGKYWDERRAEAEAGKKKTDNLTAENRLGSFNVGDTLKVHVRVTEGNKERTQLFEGIVIGKRGTGIGASFTVRKISYGEGVERVFQLHSPRIDHIEVIQRGKVRRAKLHYLRSRLGKKATQVKGAESTGAEKVAETAE